MRKFSLALAAVMASLVHTSCSISPPARLSPSGQLLTERTVQIDGQARSYREVVPAVQDGAGPLVIVLHGGGGNGSNMIDAAGWRAKAMKESFIAVFPDGTGRMAGRYTWNAGGCCAYAMTSGADDIGFLQAVISDVKRRQNVDATRIYLAGISNGGMLTYRAAAAMSQEIAAIATVVGGMFEDQARPVRPVPLLAINAVQDGVVPFEGGMSPMALVRRSASRPFLPSEVAVKRWASWNNCRAEPEDITFAEKRVEQKYIACSEGASVWFIALEEGGHGWPGGAQLRESPEQASDVINATDLIWDFFAAHGGQ